VALWLDAEFNRGHVDAEGERSFRVEGDALRADTGGNEHRTTEARSSQDHDRIIDHLALSEHEELFMYGVCFQRFCATMHGCCTGNHLDVGQEKEALR
jgi:hypothetical protein